MFYYIKYVVNKGYNIGPTRIINSYYLCHKIMVKNRQASELSKERIDSSLNNELCLNGFNILINKLRA